MGVWVLADWMAGGQPRDWSLIELGPGRGTLVKDTLRVFGQFRRVLDSLSVHLVEASPAMSRVQEATLTGYNSLPASNIHLLAPSLQERKEKWCLLGRGRYLKTLPTGPAHLSQGCQSPGIRDWKMFL